MTYLHHHHHYRYQIYITYCRELGSNPPEYPQPSRSSCPRSARALANDQIPGLPKILSSVTPQTHPGLLGICLSGAGPTILALATENFEGIAGEIVRIFKTEGIEVDWEVLEVDERGSWVEEL